MPRLNRRILEEIEKSDCDSNLKSLLRTLLYIEFSKLGETRPIYSPDYDREITNHALKAETEMED